MPPQCLNPTCTYGQPLVVCWTAIVKVLRTPHFPGSKARPTERLRWSRKEYSVVYPFIRCPITAASGDGIICVQQGPGSVHTVEVFRWLSLFLKAPRSPGQASFPVPRMILRRRSQEGSKEDADHCGFPGTSLYDRPVKNELTELDP